MTSAFIHPALSLRTVAGLGETYVCMEPVAAGTLLLREKPLLVATQLRSLPEEQQQEYGDGAEALSLDVEDLMILHAYGRIDVVAREEAVRACCGRECCAPDHPIVTSAAKAAGWIRSHDEQCAMLACEDLEQVLIVCALNAFGYLSDDLTGGATSLFPRGAKFTHRCITPSVIFHGQESSLCFRATRDLEAGEIPTISYLGANAHCGALRRRRLLWESKGFVCTCADCATIADRYRALPCPRCHTPRSPVTGLLLRSEGGTAGGTAGDGGGGGLLLRWPRVSHAEQTPSRVDLSVESDGGCGGGGGGGGGSANNMAACALDGVWRCNAASCGAELCDAALDCVCRAPAAFELWKPSGTGWVDFLWSGAESCPNKEAGVGQPKNGLWSGAESSNGVADGDEGKCDNGEAADFTAVCVSDTLWPLRLPNASFLIWEDALEEAAHNVLRLLLERSSLTDADAERTRAFAQLPALLPAVVAVLGPAHWTVR